MGKRTINKGHNPGIYDCVDVTSKGRRVVYLSGDKKAKFIQVFESIAIIFSMSRQVLNLHDEVHAVGSL